MSSTTLVRLGSTGSILSPRKPTTPVSQPVICQAAAMGDAKLVQKLLIEAGKTVEEWKEFLKTHDSHGMTPLHCAALEGQVEVVKLLVMHKADVHARDKNNWTPLHCSAAGSGERTLNHLEACEFLLRSGANPNAITETNTSVMHYLVRYPYSEKLMSVLELLREKGADVDVVEQMGDAPLHQAAWRGCKETCNFLLSAGAAVTALNQNGETPLHLAVRSERKEIVEVLLANGADPLICGQNGTARDVALSTSNQEIIDLLDEAEGDQDIELETSTVVASVSVSKLFEKQQEPPEELDPSLVRSRALSFLQEKHDVFHTYGEYLESERQEPSKSPVLQVSSSSNGPQPGLKLPLNNPRASLALANNKRRMVYPHTDFNLERGTKSREALKSFSLQYASEHDDFFYLITFVRDPEAYLKAQSKIDNPTHAVISSDYFYQHINIVAIQDAHQVIISIRKEADSSGGFPGILRSRTHDDKFTLVIETDGKELKRATTKQLLKALNAKYPTLEKLNIIKDVSLCQSLINLDRMLKIQRHKFGVVFCRDTPEFDSVFKENEVTPEFENFLEFLGKKVELKGYQGYRGDLDVRFGETGSHSYCTTWQHLEFMFQIAPFLPNERRRPLIGNTITTIVYLESGFFDFSVLESQVLHVIIVVQPVKNQVGPNGKQLYRVVVGAKKGVPRFLPVLPYPATFELDQHFRDWLFYKMVNAERAAYHCTSKVRRQVRSMAEIMQATRAGQMGSCLSKCLSVGKKKNTSRSSLKRLLSGGVSKVESSSAPASPIPSSGSSSSTPSVVSSPSPSPSSSSSSVASSGIPQSS